MFRLTSFLSMPVEHSARHRHLLTAVVLAGLACIASGIWMLHGPAAHLAAAGSGVGRRSPAPAQHTRRGSITPAPQHTEGSASERRSEPPGAERELRAGRAESGWSLEDVSPARRVVAGRGPSFGQAEKPPPPARGGTEQQKAASPRRKGKRPEQKRVAPSRRRETRRRSGRRSDSGGSLVWSADVRRDEALPDRDRIFRDDGPPGRLPQRSIWDLHGGGGGGSDLPDDRPEETGVQREEKGVYALSHFCLQSFEESGLLLFGEDIDQENLTLCSELGCWKDFPFQASPYDPPDDALWITDATAIIAGFSHQNLWHMLQHVIPLAQLLFERSSTFTNGAVHLYTIGAKADFPGNYQVGAGAPLLAAAVPKSVSAIQIRFDPKEDERRNSTRTVCYTSGLFGLPFMKIQNQSFTPAFAPAPAPAPEPSSFDPPFVERDSFLYQAASFREMEAGCTYSANASEFCISGRIKVDTYKRYRDSVLQSAGATNLSRWCPGDDRKHPLMLVVVRNHRRRLLNIGQVISMTGRVGFRVRTVRWEQLRIWSQVRLASVADVLLGVYGMGLTHVFWMRNSSVLIELYPRGVRGHALKHHGGDYATLAFVAGVQHLTWHDPNKHYNKTQSWLWRDVTVDIDKLRTLAVKARAAVENKEPC